jgi:4a-hydroxytetrahydrobiopterin dehydratase
VRTPLTEAELKAALDSLDGWGGDRAALRRTVEMPSFRRAVELVVAVADVAEEMDHHPDVDLRFTKVTFVLTTHSSHAVTELDVELAGKIDLLAVEVASRR